MARLLFLDTETGGLEAQKYSLLSIGIAIWDSNYGIIFKKNMCPITQKYIISEEALNINHFNVNDFKQEDFLSKSEIVNEFIKIKKKYFPEYKTIPLAGHNIQFDNDFLRYLFNEVGFEYESLFSYKLVDTFSILQILIHCNKIPTEISNSTKAFEFFNINVNGRHTALGDAVATAKLYMKLIKFINDNTL